ncbi:aminopeptidase N [Pseudovibrio sp. SPO723]|uniref:aminopeptidase N n=1 Tax=Nesiotobacter zosterae TaxID=392721 RepID=UPI0029C35F8D|nr:aminopeptidase N [Pseudovibrio sp. SPO723]MDX5593559.1 aminopeptidase N [Pseudovibrio sp. SPO723]
MRSDNAAPILLKDYRQTPYIIDNVELDFRLHPTSTTVRTKLHMRRRDGIAAGTPLELDGDDLKLASVAMDDIPLDDEAYEATPEKLVIHSPEAEPFTLTIDTEINPSTNTQLMGLYVSSGTFCTQCEAEGFRRITYFYDRPDVLATYTTRITASKKAYPVLLGNGNLVESGDVPSTDQHYAVWHDPHPKPSYLFALVAGNLAHIDADYTTASGKAVKLSIFVEHGNETQADWAMDSLIRSMRWDEKVFGREYDLDVFNIVAISDFNMGAMENKGLNIFNDKYILADPDTASDGDYAGIETVVAHEYFHNWTGNRITCRDWFQLCLKEGLTVFRDQEFSSDERSRAVKRIADVQRLKAAQFPEDSGPLAHPVRPEQYKEINNFYTATIYEKGAELVRMIKILLGESGFRKGMDLYFKRHDGDAATIEDFLKSFEDATGKDLSGFSLWYAQAGTPTLTAQTSHDPSAQTFTLKLTQVTPPTPGQQDKKPVVMPVRFGLVGPKGKDMAFSNVEGATVEGDVIILDQAEQTVVFHGISEKPVASLLRGFSAPVNLRSDLTLEEQLFLMRHDIDSFNRWQSAQTVATRLLVARSQGESLPQEDAFIDAMGVIASDQTLDNAFRALALQLPSEADLAREIAENVDPEALALAHEGLRTAIGQRLYGCFRELYTALTPEDASFSPSAQAAGTRALRNRLLGYLAASGEAEGIHLVKAHFDAANNMTDRLAALTLFVHLDLPGKNEALDAFEARHKSNHLAMDKWFTVQATSPAASTLERVKELTEHAGFSWTNPNRVRSLVGAFCAGNQRRFNESDGSGYDYLAEVTLKIDPKNPQLAARILNAFRSWRALEPERQMKAKAALNSILASEQSLSTDTKDIAERCLQ